MTSKRNSLWACATVLLLLVACSAQRENDFIQDDGEWITGKIVVSGTEGSIFTTLQRTDQAPIRLVGELEDELRRLSGAMVHVWGSPASREGATFMEAVVVESYEVASISGQTPYVGVLVHRDDTFWLAMADDTLQLTAVPDQLLAGDGAKVWILGRMGGGILQVQSHGVIVPGR